MKKVDKIDFKIDNNIRVSFQIKKFHDSNFTHN